MGMTIAIIGRPNVGKSTLFNRLVGKKEALVHDTPGLTRDRRYGNASLSDLSFTIIDTPGLETDAPPSHKNLLDHALWNQTKEAITEANLLFFVLDAQSGVSPIDRSIAKMIHKSNKPCLVILNKAEGKTTRHSLPDAIALGFKEVVPVSAEHGEGLAFLYESISPFCESKNTMEETTEKESNHQSTSISITVVGRPNVGKSTLINQIIDKERFTAGPEAGITRDALSVSFQWEGKPYIFVDTAGLRKRAKVTHRAEQLSGYSTQKAIQYAEIVLLVIDAERGMDKQDLSIAHHVLEEGRGLVIVINKTDVLEDFQRFADKMIKEIAASLPQVKSVPIVFVSAKTKKNLAKIFYAIQDIYQEWNTRIPTSPLNDWLHFAVTHHPPPIVKNIRVKIKYMTQIKTRPPTFALFVNKPIDLPESYVRYLRNSLAQKFDLEKVPLRLLLRKKANPFQK